MGWRGLLLRAGWRGPRGLREKKDSSSTFRHIPNTDGKAGPGKEPGPLAVQQADGENLPGVSSKVGLQASAMHR